MSDKRLVNNIYMIYYDICYDLRMVGHQTHMKSSLWRMLGTGPPRGLDRRGSDKAKWMIPITLGSPQDGENSRTRAVLPWFYIV